MKRGIVLFALALSTAAWGGAADYLSEDRQGYTIDIPGDGLADFFTWTENYPPYLAAHRGGGYLPGFPENALESIQHTLRHGHAVLEIDIQRSRDGVLLLNHDASLDRTTTGAGLIAEQDWADISKLYMVDNFGGITDYRVPSLEQVLLWGNDRTVFALDIKVNDYLPEVIQLVTRLQAEDDVFVFVYSVEQMARIAALNPRIHFAIFMTPETMPAIVDGIRQAGIALRQVAAFTVAADSSAAYNEALHALGMISIFGAFIVEHELGQQAVQTAFGDLLSSGVDIISSNRIPELAEALGYTVLPRQLNAAGRVEAPETLQIEHAAAQ